HPFLATDNFRDAGPADYIILCTKNYDLEETIDQLNPCLRTDTVIIPLLNGVDSVERIKKILPNHTVSEGCAYIVSHIKTPGVIERIGQVNKLFIGQDNISYEHISGVAVMFRNAGIDAIYSKVISAIVWSKFIFMSAVATASSY